jgi:dihydrofolate reductase
MRKIILSDHISLDGFVAGVKREIDWIHVDEELLDYIVKLTDQADTAMYGRVTYQMMDSYWPAAGKKPNASKHDIEHSSWYNRVHKVVVSNSLKGKDTADRQIIGDNLAEEVQKLKSKPGKNILIFGSPGASQSLMKFNLIDEYWLFVNPIILGIGIPLFKNRPGKVILRLVESRVFSSGVVGLHYEKI